MNPDANSRIFNRKQKTLISDLIAQKLNKFCLKYAELDMTRKSLSDDEMARLSNCYTKTFKAMDITITNWVSTTSELADSIHKN